MQIDVDNKLRDIVDKHEKYSLCDPFGRGIGEEDIDYLIEKTKLFKAIKDAWITIEFFGTSEDAEDFYTIVQDILSGDSE